MDLPSPAPDDAPEALYAQARELRARYEEKKAVIARIKQYVEPWKRDKRMKILGEMLLREIQRIEDEEARKTQREGRGV